MYIKGSLSIIHAKTIVDLLSDSIWRKLRSARRPESGLCYYHRYSHKEKRWRRMWFRWYLRDLGTPDVQRDRLFGLSVFPDHTGSQWVEAVSFLASDAEEEKLCRETPHPCGAAGGTVGAAVLQGL